VPALWGLDPDSPALPKFCINLQREALEKTRMVDVDGVATEEPYQCAGLTEFCQYEDCVAGQKSNASERPRATPLDREDLATLRLFVDPERRAALAGGKTRIHAAWGIAPKCRVECPRCNRTGRSKEGLTKQVECIKNRTTDQKCGRLCNECGNRKSDGKKTNERAKEPCAACAAKRAAKAAAAPST